MGTFFEVRISMQRKHTESLKLNGAPFNGQFIKKHRIARLRLSDFGILPKSLFKM